MINSKSIYFSYTCFESLLSFFLYRFNFNFFTLNFTLRFTLLNIFFIENYKNIIKYVFT